MITYKKLVALYAAQLRHGCMTGPALISGLLLLASLPMGTYAHGAPHATMREVEDCSWDRPGADPFMGDVVAAVDRYTDIAPQVRERLKQRMRERQYDEIAVIRRDTIRGKQYYEAQIREMHFGQGRVCRNVTRAGWSDKMEERGLVYCEQGECILVPTICRNVSRISPAGSGAPGGAGAADTAGTGASAAPDGTLPAGIVTIGGPEEGPPMWDNPGALHGGTSLGGASLGDSLPPAVAYRPSSAYEPVRLAGNTPVVYGGDPSRRSDGPGFINTPAVVPTVIVPSLPVGQPAILPAVPEPQTWAMLLAGLACIGYGALRRSKHR